MGMNPSFFSNPAVLASIADCDAGAGAVVAGCGEDAQPDKAAEKAAAEMTNTLFMGSPLRKGDYPTQACFAQGRLKAHRVCCWSSGNCGNCFIGEYAENRRRRRNYGKRFLG